MDEVLELAGNNAQEYLIPQPPNDPIQKTVPNMFTIDISERSQVRRLLSKIKA
jgi:hypothetical protein